MQKTATIMRWEFIVSPTKEKYLRQIDDWVEQFFFTKGIENPSKERKQRVKIGKVAEVAVSFKTFGKDVVDWNLYPTKGDDGIDFIIPAMGIVQVKATPYYKYPELKEYHPIPKEKSDYYCLVAINPDEWTASIKGCIKTDHFLSSKFFVENYRDLGPRYIARVSDLINFPVFGHPPRERVPPVEIPDLIQRNLAVAQ